MKKRKNTSRVREITLAYNKQQVIFRKLADKIPSTTYGTFGLYRYPAKFIPQVIAYALKEYSKKGMSVFDPFAGYGTVGTVAKLYGNDYELWDINPLLSHLHSVAIMNSPRVDVDELINKMTTNRKSFRPDWKNLEYWFNEEFLPVLSRSWGFYHSLENETYKKLLLIPLLKATKYFSYNDQQRQKLSRSPLAEKRIQGLLSNNWETKFFKMVLDGANEIKQKIREYSYLQPADVKSTVRAGYDSITSELRKEHDILITSPPYLQAQEYIRASKIDLFWLGYSEEEIKKFGKMEIPYRPVPSIDILSPTYKKHLCQIEENHMRQVYERYFHGVLGALSRLQESIRKHLLLFVGSANLRGKQIPIDDIFIEHLTSLGWKHESTLVDTIVARQLFMYKANPATGIRDDRMLKEQLVILSRT